MVELNFLILPIHSDCIDGVIMWLKVIFLFHQLNSLNQEKLLFSTRSSLVHFRASLRLKTTVDTTLRILPNSRVLSKEGFIVGLKYSHAKIHL